jgi:hypothetical protein
MEAKFKAILANFNSPLWSSHVRIPAAIAKKFLKADAKRVVCTINGEHEYQCGIMPNGDEYYFLLVNKPTVKKLKLNFGDEITIVMKKDESEFGLPMPEEFEVLLAEDPDFEKHFMNLTPGKQRTLLYMIGQVKSSDIRIRKAVVIADHLKANSGKLDFKMLNVAFKG